MIKIIFIDDEISTLNLLKNIIDWNNYGIQIAGTAINGIEGLALYHKVSPDIIIADIKMPGMDGLSFVKAVREKNENVKIFILSAYGEFEYAREAINYKITDYLLKPLDEDKLIPIIQKTVDEINQNKNIVFKKEIEKRISFLLIKYKTANYNFTQNKDSTDFYNNILILKSIDMAMVITLTRNLETDFYTQSMYDETENILLRHLTMNHLCLVLSRNEAAVFLDHIPFEKHCDALIAELSGCFAKSGISVVIGVGEVKGASQILESFQQAQYASYQYFYDDTSNVIYYDKHISFFDDLKLNYDDLTNSIKLLVEQQSPNILLFNLDQKLDYFYSVKARPDAIFEFLMNIFIYIKIELTAIYAEKSINILRNITPETFGVNGTYQTTKKYVSNYIQLIIQSLQELPGIEAKNTVIKKAKEYIACNYSIENFSLQELANYVGLSKNYFSGAFKIYEGETVWEYLTKIRINKSMELLKSTNYTIFEISQKVGYKSEYHFYRLFKKMVGMTPQQFRKKV